MENLPEFIANHSLLVFAFVAIAGFLFWNLLNDGPGAGRLSPNEAVDYINHQEAVVIDVRENNEFENGHIIDSIHIPLGRLKTGLKPLEVHKTKPVIISCMSGSRSAQACNTLRKNGFEQVFNLKGGVMAWQNASLPLVKGKVAKEKQKRKKNKS